jgi:hypothetical protein
MIKIMTHTATLLIPYSNKQNIATKLAAIANKRPIMDLTQMHTDKATVYYIFSYFTKADYIGETKNWMQRFQTEIQTARRWHPKRRDDKNVTQAQYNLEKALHKFGYQNWMVAAIRYVHENADTQKLRQYQTNRKQLRLQHEAQCIRWLQPKINHVSRPIETIRIYKGKQNRKRPPRNKRKRGVPKQTLLEHKKARLNTPQCKYTWKQGKLLGEALNMSTILKAMKPHRKGEITKHIGDNDMTDYKHIQRIYPKLQFRIQDTDTWHPVNQMKTYMSATTENTVCYVQNIEKNETQTLREKLLKLTKHRYALHRDLKHWSLKKMIEAWVTTHTEISEKQGKTLIKNRIMRKIRNRFLTQIPHPTFTIRYTKFIQRDDIRKIINEEIMSHLDLEESTKESLKTMTKVIYTKNPSIKDVLVNNTKIGIHTIAKCRGAPYCHGDEHFQERLANMPQIPPNIRNRNANMVPIPTKKYALQDVYITLTTYINNTDTIHKKNNKEMVNGKRYAKAAAMQGNIVCRERNNKHQRPGDIILIIPAKRMKWLTKMYNHMRVDEMANKETQGGASLMKHIYAMANRYKYLKRQDTGTIIPEVYQTLRDILQIKIERLASPLDTSNMFKRYNSKYEEDAKFGSEGNALHKIWNINSVAYAADNIHMTQKTINHAIWNSHRNPNIITVVIYNNHDPDRIITVTQDYVQMVVQWEPNTFVTRDHINREKTRTVTSEVILIVIANTTIPESKKQQTLEQLNKIQKLRNSAKNETEAQKRDNTLVKRIQDLPRVTKQTWWTTEQKQWQKAMEKTHMKTQGNKRRSIHEIQFREAMQRIGRSPTKIINDLQQILKPKETIESQDNDTPTREDLEETYKLLKGLVVMVLDKNDGALYAECPIIHQQRLRRNVCTTDFKQVEMSTTVIISRIEKEFHNIQLHKIAPWNDEGSLPNIYVNAKHKDPINKERLISSYYNHVAKKPFKLISKVLTWLLRNLDQRHFNFTLHKLTDMKARMHDINTKLTKTKWSTIHARQYDVKCMFTNLNQQHIKQSIMWLLQIYLQDPPIELNIRKTKYANGALHIQRAHPHEIQWGKATNELSVNISFDDIINATNLDIDYAYAICGDVTIKQQAGCPIGGILSSNYANITCAKYEHEYLQLNPDIAERIHAFRQMDDLGVIIVSNKLMASSDDDIYMQQFIHDVLQGNIYKGGLEIEQEDVKSTRCKFTMDFAGKLITGHQKRGELNMYTNTKNWDTIVNEGKQKIFRFPPGDSYIPRQIKDAVIMGSLHRMEGETLTQQDLTTCIQMDIIEMCAIKYTKKQYKRQLQKIAAKLPQWKTIHQDITHWMNMWTQEDWHEIAQKIKPP